jgi:hypothetical protein
VAEALQAVGDRFVHEFESWLHEAGVEVYVDIGGPKDASVLPTPGGPTLFVDMHDVGPDAAVVFVEHVLADLEAIGEGAVELGRPPWQELPSALVDLTGVRAVELRLFNDEFMPDAVPAELINEAAQWLVDQHAPEVLAQVGLAAFPASDAEVPALLATIPATIVEVMAGPTSELRRVEYDSGLLLGFGGTDVSEAALVGEAEALIDTARRVAPYVGQAFVDFTTKFSGFSAWNPEPTGVGRAPADLGAVAWLLRIAVYDVAPFQILSESHVARLDPVARARCTEIAGGRYELSVGRLEDWLPGRPRTELISEGRRLLQPLLFSNSQLAHMFTEGA